MPEKTINEVRIMGRLAKDPYRGQGKRSPFAFLRVATGHGKFTAFHDVSCFGDVTGDVRDVKKGDMVEVEGRLSYRDMKKGEISYREASIIADRVKSFLPEIPQQEEEEDADIPF